MRRPGRSFYVRLGVIAAVALGLRAIYVLAVAPAPIFPAGDTFWFAFVSDEVAQGHGFVIGHGSLFSPSFRLVATALHPPLYPLALAGLRELGVMDPRDLLWLGPVTGTFTVVGLGLLGRAIATPRIGLAAAGLAAVYPLLIVPDGALLSETLYGPAVILVLSAALALARRPGLRPAAMVGLAVGLAALVRAEALGLVVLLALPLAWRGPGGTARAGRLATTLLCTLAVITPWVVRNENALGTLTLSTNDGVTVAVTNCAPTYHGPDLGYLDGYCVPSQLKGNEAQQSATLMRQGLRFASHHVGRLPIVALARLARTWELFHPFRGSIDEGRNATVSDVGVVLFYPIAAFALFGAWVMRRRRAELWVLLAPLVLVTLVGAATYGSLRLRYLAELALVLLAAVGADALSERRLARRRVQTGSVPAPA